MNKPDKPDNLDTVTNILSRQERFMATVYAINTLLLYKGIYTIEEFDAHFLEWARKNISLEKTPPGS